MGERFMLTNAQRRYVGLNPVEAHWDVMDIKGTLYYFEGDTIRKEISTSDSGKGPFYYRESELDVKTAENRTVVLPKTARGKPRKLNLTATRSFRPYGTYFSYGYGRVMIGNYTTQKTFYSESLNEGDSAAVLSAWLEKWVTDTTEGDLEELETFRTEKREHQNYREGDIFAFKFGRRRHGFGKILIDVTKRRKTEDFKRNKNCGLSNLMGTALVVKVYHRISDTIEVDIDELERGMALPPQIVMDNTIFYGEHKVIGNRAVAYKELDDAPISVSRSIDATDPDFAYLQYGLIYRELTLSEYKMHEDEGWYHRDYRREDNSFTLDLQNLERCVREGSNAPFYPDADKGGLNNPRNKEDKDRVFAIFGLDGRLGYEGNLRLHQAR